MLEIPNKNIDHEIYGGLLDYHTISTDASEKGKLSCIGINQHLSRLIRVQKLRTDDFWFNDYLKDESFDNYNNNNEVCITAYLKFIRSTKTLDDDFISSNIAKYSANEYGSTHIVKQVEYGAEFILWAQKPIDPSKETKETTEQTMRVAVKTFLREYFDAVEDDLPVLADDLNMSWSLHSSLYDEHASNWTLMQCLQFMEDLINIEANDGRNVWRPITLQLRPIPTVTEVEIANDLHTDTVFELERRQQWIKEKCHHLMTESPCLYRASFLKKPLVEFQKLVEPIRSLINETIDKVQNRYFPPKDYLWRTKRYVGLLDEALRWLTRYREDIEQVDKVLKGNSLPVIDLQNGEATKKRERDGDLKRVKVFVLHLACVSTGLDERLNKWIQFSGSLEDEVFPIEAYTLDAGNILLWPDIYKKWQIFVNEAIRSKDKGVDYAVGILTPKSLYKEGSVFTMSYGKSMLPLYPFYV